MKYRTDNHVVLQLFVCSIGILAFGLQTPKWSIATGIITVLWAIAHGGLYIYKPELFNKKVKYSPQYE